MAASWQPPPGAARHRDDLTGEHPWGDLGQGLCAIAFAVVWIADAFFLNRTTFLNDRVPAGTRIPLGLVLLCLAGYLAARSLAQVFGQVPETPAVIREGLYRVVRHPMYLGEILLYLGFLMLSLSLAAAVVWVMALLFLHRIARYEERLLLARFGEAYAEYMRQVPMWIPRLIKR